MEYLSQTMLTEVQSDPMQLVCYDLAIIGAGVSSAYTLIHYIAGLEKQAAIESDDSLLFVPVKILVTEKSGEFWTGLPYGSRSGRNALLIAPLHEFIPQVEERQDFINWLTKHQAEIFNPAEYRIRGELSAKWLQANQESMSQGLWDDIFIPRHIFGLYIKQRVDLLLQTTAAKGLIEFKLITADAIDVQLTEDIYQVDLAGKDHSCFFTKKLVLAIGSPPNVAFTNPPVPGTEDRICYVDNMYEPSLDSNIDRIRQALQQVADPAQRQVLMVGSNAGTLDTLYSINNSTETVNLIDKFVIVSPNAAFPHRITRGIVELGYIPQNLLDLVSTKSFTAKQIFTAVAQDVAAATAKNINVSDIHGDISKVVMQALNLLNPDEQKQFVVKYAVEIGKLQRRAGGEYLDVVQNLRNLDRLEFIKGKFVKYSTLATGVANCEYLDSEDSQQKVVDASVSVIINCAGFQDVTKSSSPLINNLIKRGICIPNESHRGFVCDKNFTAGKNCYLMGPLVAGNMDGSFKVWHAESCQRIINLSQQLATTLLESEQIRSTLAIVPEVENAKQLATAA
jgi:uncharacterized NAD(P)/FAD-binding protein YdhS